MTHSNEDNNNFHFPLQEATKKHVIGLVTFSITIGEMRTWNKYMAAVN